MHCCRIVNGIKNKNIKNSLGAMWNATHLAVRLCALRHWKRVPMPLTTQSLRHPLTRVFHFAPRLFFMFLFLIPFTIRQQCIIYPHKFSIDSCLFCAWWCLIAFGAILILVDTLRL